MSNRKKPNQPWAGRKSSASSGSASLEDAALNTIQEGICHTSQGPTVGEATERIPVGRGSVRRTYVPGPTPSESRGGQVVGTAPQPSKQRGWGVAVTSTETSASHGTGIVVTAPKPNESRRVFATAAEPSVSHGHGVVVTPPTRREPRSWNAVVAGTARSEVRGPTVTPATIVSEPRGREIVATPSTSSEPYGRQVVQSTPSPSEMRDRQVLMTGPTPSDPLGLRIVVPASNPCEPRNQGIFGMAHTPNEQRGWWVDPSTPTFTEPCVRHPVMTTSATNESRGRGIAVTAPIGTEARIHGAFASGLTPGFGRGRLLPNTSHTVGIGEEAVLDALKDISLHHPELHYLISLNISNLEAKLNQGNMASALLWAAPRGPFALPNMAVPPPRILPSQLPCNLPRHLYERVLSRNDLYSMPPRSIIGAYQPETQYPMHHLINEASNFLFTDYSIPSQPPNRAVDIFQPSTSQSRLNNVPPRMEGPAESLYANPWQQGLLNDPNAANDDLWYYEDPKQVVHGPFTAIEMYNWFVTGFFDSYTLVRRSSETQMQPLFTFGPVPFIPRPGSNTNSAANDQHPNPNQQQ